ncbi:hypothetical protein R1sor_000519 [Riccia sorocarpa]|uniref:Protein kinase domain-containing protein n=1 Tax=Riccia sorocarpa TaxID=122646 RepID=A0ABD3GVQ6_9MARC
MVGVINDLSDQITRLIYYLKEVKKLTGYDVGLQAEINNFMRALSTNLAYLKTSLPYTVSKDAIGLLANEVAEANKFMGECLEQDKFKRIWSARETRSTLESLRQKLVSCFQLAFFITSLDVTIEGRNRATDFQQRMLDLFFTHASDPLAARGQLQTLLQPLASEIKRQDQKLEKLVEFVKRGGAANTGIATDRSTETEKFFADVLATVEQLQSNYRYRDPSSSSPNHDDSPDSSDSALEELVYDPVTKEIMIDPVKGSDRYTYDRWTIVNNNLVVSPFTREPLSIVSDDVTLRSLLFTKFHSQKLEEKFLGLREEYRRTTLDLVGEGHDGENLERLEHVLKWAPKDSECQELQRKISSRLEKWRALAESASPVFLVSNRINPNNAVGAGSSFTPQPDDMEVVKANSSVGPNTVAAGESILSPKFDSTAHKLDHSSQVPAGELKFSSQSDVVLSVGKDSSTQQDVEGGTGAKLVSQLDHARPVVVTKTSFAPQDLPPKKSWFSAIRKFLRGCSSTASASSAPPPTGGSACRQDRAFTLHELEVMTNNFMSKIGEGMYYGRLSNGTPVAVKVNSMRSHCGTREFEFEVETSKHIALFMVTVHHRNLVSLLGYCQENRQRILVYELMSEGTLREHLYGRELKGRIGWTERLDIALNAARGLEYLHISSGLKLKHRYITSDNILLNDKLLAKVAGLGFWFLTLEEDSVSGVSTFVENLGYLDPEYYIHSTLRSESDVYSFGVVLLEIICGRPPTKTTDNHINLVEWARGQLNSDDLESIIDPFIKGTYNMESMWKVAQLAMTCVEPYGINRPDMNQVVQALLEAVQLQG